MRSNDLDERMESTVTVTPEQLAWYDYAAGFRDAALRDIVAIQLAESSGNETSINNSAFPTQAGYHDPGGYSPEYSVGISQINALAHFATSGVSSFSEYIAKLQDPLFNAQEAFRVSGGSDFTPWTTYTGGQYLQYLNGAQGASSGITPVSFPSIPIPNLNPTDIPGVGDIAGTIAGPFKKIGDVFGALANPQLWWRVLFTLVGLGMIGTGIFVLAQGSSVVRGAERMAVAG